MSAGVDPRENALLWIRHMAGVHYLGAGFDPEHMRAIANVAADALGGRPLPDFAEAGERARAWADEQAAWFAAHLADEDAGDDGEDGG